MFVLIFKYLNQYPVPRTYPQAGAVCVFRQPPGKQYLHDGEVVRSGYKYDAYVCCAIAQYIAVL